MEETIISKMKSQIEEIEKRIKAIAMQMTTTSQMSAIKYCLEEIKQLLVDLGNECDTHLADFSEHKELYNELLQKYNTLYENFNNHIDNYDSSVAENSTTHTEIQNNIDDIIYALQEVEAQADDLETRVMVLEDLGGSTGSQTPMQLQVETTNFVEYIELTPCIKKSSEYVSPLIYFMCEPTQTLQLKLVLEGEIYGNSIKRYIEFIINNEHKVAEIKEPVSSGSFKYEFMVTYIPKKKFNNMYFIAQFNNSFSIKRCYLNVTGRNICLFNKEKDLKIVCFDDKYYITYATSLGYFLYGVQNRGELSLNATNLTQLPVDNFTKKYYLLTMIPALVNNEEPLAYDQNYINQVLFIALDGTSKHAPQTLRFNSENNIEQRLSWTLKISGLDIIPNGIGKGSEVFVLTTGEGKVYLLGRGSMYKEIKYNNEQLNNEWYDVATVKNNNAKIGDENTQFNGVILLRNDGKNVFFPSFDNTYYVEIAEGRNVSAYLQEDGSINVYINRLCNIYKYVLRKNLNGVFEVSNIVTCIKGITRYEELYDGEVLAYENSYFLLTTKDALETE